MKCRNQKNGGEDAPRKDTNSTLYGLLQAWGQKSHRDEAKTLCMHQQYLWLLRAQRCRYEHQSADESGGCVVATRFTECVTLRLIYKLLACHSYKVEQA